MASDWIFSSRPPVASIADLRRAIAARRFDRGIGHALIAFVEHPEKSLRAVARDHQVDPGGLCRAIRSIPGASSLREARKNERPNLRGDRAARRLQRPELLELTSG